ncbi:serine hydrolase [Terrihabitans rhizophilus]|uniref:Serine hydrolase n=1 Tax=Terrihabitans rhizophilus TaxID=3092662 RepID=A0ABU4RJZ5_9HYPH|nr:serine hydrolase [Terrihabitans sp. PJ23]MDX6805161.1 serine hydrolase [Terrihabitans sp. PJ23]
MRALSAALVLGLMATTPSEAAKKKASSKKELSQKSRAKKAPAGGGYNPPYSAIVVDAKTGRVLHSDSQNAIRHPASLTKVMTLYVLFEELERGSVDLDTPLKVSANAARQAPSKLGLRPGETIRVEDAIKALVTKSANDVAYTIGENLSGSETAFAQRMTRKARALGMSSTVYANASGLPDDRQVTTAADLAILGRAVQDRFPKYFPYFNTRTFTWKGRVIGNHNRLVGSVRGVDGIKTGFVRASGFNLLTSANDNGRSIVAVVLGGRSGASRDAAMRKLVAENLPKASTGAKTSVIAEGRVAPEPLPTLTTQVAAAAPVAATTTTTTTATRMPLPKPRTPDLAAVESTPVPAPSRPAAVTAAAAPAAPTVPASAATPATSPDAIARRIAMATAVATTPVQPDMRWVVGSQPAANENRANGGTTPGSSPRQVAQVEIQRPVEAGMLIPSMRPAPEPRAASTKVAAAYADEPTAGNGALAAIAPQRPGWQIQIGATDDAAKAAALLDRAQPTMRKIDSRAQSFTETVNKGEVTLYRARFAGLTETSAQAACKALKKSALSCFALKN